MAKGNFIEYVEHYALPNVTTDDNGKILQVVGRCMESGNTKLRGEK